MHRPQRLAKGAHNASKLQVRHQSRHGKPSAMQEKLRQDRGTKPAAGGRGDTIEIFPTDTVQI